MASLLYSESVHNSRVNMFITMHIDYFVTAKRHFSKLEIIITYTHIYVLCLNTLLSIKPIIKVRYFYFKLFIKFNFIHELSQFPKSIISE